MVPILIGLLPVFIMGVRDIQKIINVRREARAELEETLKQLETRLSSARAARGDSDATADPVSAQRRWMRKAVKGDSNEGLFRETPKPGSADSYEDGKWKWNHHIL